MKQRTLITPQVTFGSDPELFLRRKDGRVIGSEKVIPTEGIPALMSKIIRDGVQVELNPRGVYCRQYMGREFQAMFAKLASTLPDDVEVDFSGLVEVSSSELGELAPESRRLGCMPSHNAHTPGITPGVNAETYTKRSAGGHLHVRWISHRRWDEVLDKEINYNPTPSAEELKALVPLLDIIVGNTCVLIDRDPGAAERRQVYGRAGEYRLPENGLEYRTLSNFWLRSYPLMGFVFSLFRTAIYYHASGFGDEIITSVELRKVVKAINENDAELARENFDAFIGWHQKTVVKNQWLMDKSNPYLTFTTQEEVENFNHFVARGLDYWWPMEGTLKRWVDYLTPELKFYDGSKGAVREVPGWERFLSNTVAEDHTEAVTAAAKARVQAQQQEAA